jgi:hypothetical protein
MSLPIYNIDSGLVFICYILGDCGQNIPIWHVLYC